MTSLIPSPLSPQFRRHSDPPKLWLWILAGSLLFHLMAWAIGRKLLATSVTQTDSTAIAVEFLEPIGDDAGVFSRQSGLSQQKDSQPKDSRPKPPVEDNATQTTLSPPAISEGMPAERVANDSRIAQNQPMTQPSATISPSRPTQTTLSPKTPVSSVANSPPINLQPKRPSTTDAPMVDNSTKTPVVATSNVRLPDLPIVPNSTDAPPKQDSSGAIAPIPVPSNSAPAQFMAQFRAIGSTPDPSNSVESIISAQLLGEPTKLFSSDPSLCALTPDALNNFGQPVRLKLSLDETGTFNSQKLVTIKQSSGNIHYDELATCVTKISRFIPAYQLEGSTKRAVSSELEIQVTLVQ